MTFKLKNRARGLRLPVSWRGTRRDWRVCACPVEVQPPGGPTIRLGALFAMPAEAYLGDDLPLQLSQPTSSAEAAAEALYVGFTIPDGPAADALRAALLTHLDVVAFD